MTDNRTESQRAQERRKQRLERENGVRTYRESRMSNLASIDEEN
jgi:hypothetical protein